MSLYKTKCALQNTTDKHWRKCQRRTIFNAVYIAYSYPVYISISCREKNLEAKISIQVTFFSYLSPEFYICTLIVDIIVKNNNFQEIQSKSKEMTFTETNMGSKSTSAYDSFPLKVLDKET